MILPANDDRAITSPLSLPAIGIALSALLHAMVWVLWGSAQPVPESKIAPPEVIEASLVAARQSVPEAPPPVERPKPQPPPPKPEKTREKPVPKRPEKPKLKSVEKKAVPPLPLREEITSTPAPAAPEPVVAAPAKTVTASPAPFVEASFKSPELNNPPTRFPAIALERRWEGTVALRVQVLPSGLPGDIRVEHSSGHEILDDDAAEQVRHWRFRPARRGEQAVVSSVIVPIQYRLKH